ncbi:DoxX family protein [Microbulbifer sp. 2201CG32-9]|uniref:DoxX family protein n=1 Tax=Microbulbifer sp. 2201CG32-9 TaxID=3232309 RepID=UPI00345B89CE
MNTLLFGGHKAKSCDNATIFIRLAVGLAVFFPEGLQKVMFADILGAGRFARIGIPEPEFFGYFVGVVEILCGLMIIFGIATRLATVPLIITMCVALVSTKLPILLGHDWWVFHVRELSRYGFWSAQHEARTDMVMLLSLVFLFIAGAGRWSVDRWLWRNQKHGNGANTI